MTLICYANDSSSILRVRHTYTITVANASETLNVHLSSDDNIIVFNLLSNFILNCSIANNTDELKIHWYKNDQEIIDDGKAQLQIFNATVLNEGIYKCAIEINGGNASKIILYQTFKAAFKPYWSKWSQWSRCGKKSMKQRNRICHHSKILQPDEKWRCIGVNLQRKRCKTIASWTEWSDWSECSRTCGYGQMFRYRECTADQCNGPNVEVIECFRIHCAKNALEIPKKNQFLPYKMYSKSLG